MMTLRVTLPDRALFEGSVTKVVAEGVDGSRGFLPRHVDFVMPLRTGVVSCVQVDGAEKFFAVRGGVLVKKGPSITIATRSAVMGDSMAALPDSVLQAFAQADEQEREARKVAVQLETVLLREFLDLHR